MSGLLLTMWKTSIYRNPTGFFLQAIFDDREREKIIDQWNEDAARVLLTDALLPTRDDYSGL
jgi:hypothetical protein